MDEKTKRKEKPHTLNQKYGLLIVVLALLILTAYNSITAPIQRNAGLDVLYPLIVLPGFLGQSIFILLTGVLSAWIFLFSLRNLEQRIRVKFSLLACFLIPFCMYSSVINFSNSFEDYTLPIRHIVIDEQTYRIALIEGPTDSGFGDVGYAIYRCEDNFSCLLIHSEKPVDYPSTAPDISVEDDGTRIIIEIKYWQRDITSYTHSYLEISEMR